MSYFVQNPLNNKELNIDNLEELILPNSVKTLLLLVKKQILKLDSPYHLFKLDKNSTIEVEDIKHLFIHRYMYRRGCIMVAIQKSILENKLVWYYTKTIHHTAECYGTSPSIELIEKNKKELYQNKKFMEIIKKISKKL